MLLQCPDLALKWSDRSNFKHANLVMQQTMKSSEHQLERSQEILLVEHG